MNGKYVLQELESSFKQKWVIWSVLIFNRHTLYCWGGFSETRNEFGISPLQLADILLGNLYGIKH